MLNQDPTHAQLTLNYNLHEEKLQIGTSDHASELFLQFARSTGRTDGWYAIFLDRKKRFLCWYNVENFLDIPLAVTGIAGSAKIVGARHVVMARLDDGENPTVGYLDFCWIASLLEACGNRRVHLDDYLVVTERGWCSYRDGRFIA